MGGKCREGAFVGEDKTWPLLVIRRDEISVERARFQLCGIFLSVFGCFHENNKCISN